MYVEDFDKCASFPPEKGISLTAPTQKQPLSPLAILLLKNDSFWLLYCTFLYVAALTEPGARIGITGDGF